MEHLQCRLEDEFSEVIDAIREYKARPTKKMRRLLEKECADVPMWPILR